MQVRKYVSQFVVLTAILAGASSAAEMSAESAQTIKADRTVLLDLARVGSSLLAVGERGLIIRSEDLGGHWHGIQSGVTRTLTAIATRGDVVVAVGHNATLLRSTDAAKSWKVVPLADVGNASLLGVTVLPSGKFVAYGAFGTYLESLDNGAHWVRRKILEDRFEAHISQVISVDAERSILVGEAGTLALSDDDGLTWTKVKSPYEGSFFGAVSLKDGTILVFGMRGNVFRSVDRGSTWVRQDTNTTQGINGGYVSANGRVALVGNAGTILISDDGGRKFRKQVIPGNVSLAKAVIENNDVVFVGAFAAGKVALASAK